MEGRAAAKIGNCYSRKRKSKNCLLTNEFNTLAPQAERQPYVPVSVDQIKARSVPVTHYLCLNDTAGRTEKKSHPELF